ncbi:MAG: hypothetical protein IJF73_03285 [Clostridia bacterium]|nr:hypothetical protein [Clostridia bacterium]
MNDVFSFAEELGFSAEQTERLRTAYKALATVGGDIALSEAVRDFFPIGSITGDEVLVRMRPYCEAAGVHEYTAAALYVLANFLFQREEYVAAYGEEIFLDSARDLLYKVRELETADGITGTCSLNWFFNFLRRELFALGRLEFHVVGFNYPALTIGEHTIRKGDPVIKVHIPSSGRMTGEECLDAYRRAYRHFRHRFSDDVIPFICYTWLLDPEISEKMPDGGIAQFASAYTTFDSIVHEDDDDIWRVFGKRYTDYSLLPRGNRLQRLLADRLQAGGHFVSGRGAFFHDGESVVNTGAPFTLTRED